MKVTEDSRLFENLQADLIGSLFEASETAADILRENISAGPRSGRQWPDLPRRSSAPEEYPQEQFGDLKRSVDVRAPGPPLVMRVGFFDEDMEKLEQLEFGTAFVEARAPLSRTMESPTTQEAMTQAIREEVKR